jgi:hypothetical protein
MRVNYQRTWIARAPEQSTANLIVRPNTDVTQATQYFDGLDRPIETIIKAFSPAGNDMATANYYDASTGNEIYKYLPFISNTATTGDITSDGNLKLDRFQQQVSFYNTYLAGQPNETSSSSSNPNWAYSKTNFEASPQRRILNQFAAGVSWVGSEGSTNHNVQQQSLVNTSNDQVQIWNISTTKAVPEQFPQSQVIPTNGGAYGAGQLYKTIITDEQTHQTIEFKDMYGQVILRKVQNSVAADNGTGSSHAGWLCTYYVYDDYGNLRFIIPPNVVQLIDGNWTAITQSYVDELCYYFEYDNLNRMVIKKTPGTPTGINGEVWMVYDQRDRLVMQQDGYQRAAQKWKYFQYDGLDRIIGTGFLTDPSSNISNYNDLNNQLNSASSTTTWPNLSSYTTELLSQVFYDNYSWMNSTNSSTLPSSINTGSNGSGNSSFLAANNSSVPYPQAITQSTITHGMATGSKIEVLGSNGGQFIYAVSFYDSKGRAIQTQTINFSGGLDISTTQYDWSGKVLVNLVSHNLVSSATPQTHNIATVMNYDAMGRLTTINKTVNSTVNGTVIATKTSQIASYQYDELSQLKKKIIGNNIETLTYDYNVRGWLLGENRDYAKTPLSTTNFFGYDIGYDKAPITPTGGSSIGSYTTQVFNGNIEGTVWKSRGDGVARKFDYTYDKVNRLLSAPYLESTSPNSWGNSYINFSVSNLSYDGNGNIGNLQQYGFLVGGSQPIDNLSYSYVGGQNNTTGANYSNRLTNVMDQYNNPQSTLGDFKYTSTSKTSSNVDYTYNANGNIISDYNRNISGVTYYYDMNLPNILTITNKGTVQYTYDAAGNKLQKQTIQNNATVAYNGTNYTTNITTTTKYIDGFVYKTVSYSNSSLTALNTTDLIQFTGHEEGRMRLVLQNSGASIWIFDYFLRDQLSNVRMVLTDEQQTDVYPPATVETTPKTVNGITSTPAAFEGQYYTINANNIIPVSSLSWWTNVTNNGYYNTNGTPPNNDPYSNNPTTTVSANVYKLNGSTGDKTGLGITLKVTAGDVVNIYGKSAWHNTGTPVSYQAITSSPLVNFLTAFANSSAVVTGGHGVVTATTLNNTSATTTPLTSMLNNTQNQTQNTTYAPKAAINWILFDDQFRPVANGIGTSLVSATPDQVYSHPTIPINISMIQSGYLYVYCSNESNVDVFFDNLQVTLAHSPMVEETHYYPTGLAMAGISDKAWGKLPNYYHFQGNEIQTQEFNDGTGIEEYDFNAIQYDQQLGVWHAQDPASQFASPYMAMGNNWIKGTDKDGKWFGFDDIIVSGIGFVVGYVGYGLETHHWGGRALLSGFAGAAIAEGGYLTLGGGLAATTAGASESSALLTTAGTEALVTGGSGSMAGAVSFAATYAASDATSLLQNSGQLQNDSWHTFGLIAGYSSMASVQAGFQSNYMQGKIDNWIGINPQGKLGGVFSNGFGGFISNFGNNILQSYNSSSNSWKDLNLGDAFSSGWTGFESNSFGQLAHNIINNNEWLNKHLDKLFNSALSNAASSFTQQLITNGFNLDKYNTDLFSTNTFLNGLGGWPGDLLNGQ